MNSRGDGRGIVRITGAEENGQIKKMDRADLIPGENRRVIMIKFDGTWGGQEIFPSRVKEASGNKVEEGGKKC